MGQPMVLVKNWPFFHLFVSRQQSPEKKRLSRLKIEIFQKGITHGFGQKLAIYPFFSFQAIQPSKIRFKIFYLEKTPFQAIKTTSQKSLKIDIFPKGLTHGFRPTMSIFPTFFLGNIVQENVFYDILERKNAFLGYKNKKIKRG